ncbi:MAG: hypothetical protein DRI01_08880 [Chloroflexi bacterium]|nr:MAG: hypothetical protein DRI01_08880 [Chloroflexota bacterium]
MAKDKGANFFIPLAKVLMNILKKPRTTKQGTTVVGTLTDYYPSYFPENIENFAVILKGKSIEKISQVYRNYNDCFIVNNFDKEIELLERYLVAKNTVHFVNRLMTAPLTPENYQKLGITDIQLSKVSDKGDKALKKAIKHYTSLGLKTHFLPERLLRFTSDFGAEYAIKYPNTGILAVIYALDIIRPKNLWIVGLDFYQADYLARRPHQNPIELQREKMNRLGMDKVFINIVNRYPEVNVNMVTYYQGLPELKNLNIL